VLSSIFKDTLKMYVIYNVMEGNLWLVFLKGLCYILRYGKNITIRIWVKQRNIQSALRKQFSKIFFTSQTLRVLNPFLCIRQWFLYRYFILYVNALLQRCPCKYINFFPERPFQNWHYRKKKGTKYTYLEVNIWKERSAGTEDPRYVYRANEITVALSVA
jgi:hypothetical protein